MLSWCHHLPSPEGSFLALKGQYPEQELAQLPDSIRLVATHKLVVPELEGERHLLEFKAIQPGIGRRIHLGDSVGKVIAIANQKGGVGKTTTCVNLAAPWPLPGARCWVIDLDPQGNATMGSGVDKYDVERTAYELLIEDAPIGEVGSSPKPREAIT